MTRFNKFILVILFFICVSCCSVGNVAMTDEELINFAIKQWKQTYSLSDEDIDRRRPYVVQDEGECWIVKGTMPKSKKGLVTGGNPKIKIKKADKTIVYIKYGK